LDPTQQQRAHPTLSQPRPDHSEESREQIASAITEPFLKVQHEFEAKLNGVMQQLNELKANADCASRAKIESDCNHLHTMKLGYIEKLQENQFQLMTQIISILGKENMKAHVHSEHTADRLKTLIDSYRKEMLNLNLINDSNLNDLTRTYDISSCDEARRNRPRSKGKRKSKTNSADSTKSRRHNTRPVFLQELLDQAPSDERAASDQPQRPNTECETGLSLESAKQGSSPCVARKAETQKLVEKVCVPMPLTPPISAPFYFDLCIQRPTTTN
jgi:hypothetical protein